jgi:hypothetical protein
MNAGILTLLRRARAEAIDAIREEDARYSAAHQRRAISYSLEAVRKIVEAEGGGAAFRRDPASVRRSALPKHAELSS